MKELRQNTLLKAIENQSTSVPWTEHKCNFSLSQILGNTIANSLLRFNCSNLICDFWLWDLYWTWKSPGWTPVPEDESYYGALCWTPETTNDSWQFGSAHVRDWVVRNTQYWSSSAPTDVTGTKSIWLQLEQSQADAELFWDLHPISSSLH